jgi:hypothetical protein
MIDDARRILRKANIREDCCAILPQVRTMGTLSIARTDDDRWRISLFDREDTILIALSIQKMALLGSS